MKCLEVEKLKKSYPQGWQSSTEILKNISFSLREGVTTGFIGANGSGKTTTLKCLLGFITPNGGRIHFWGQELTNDIKKKIGYFPERPYLYEFLTAQEYLHFHWRLAGGGEGFQRRSEEVLEMVNLKVHAKKLLREFSKGMLQRVGIAQAILLKPQLLILDEPMSGLDPDGRLIVKDIIKQLHQKGVTIFFSSHLLSDMDELCQDLVVIDQGDILYNGEVEKFSSLYSAFSLIVYIDQNGQRKEIQIDQTQVQSTIDELRRVKSNIIKIQPLSQGIEGAFEQLRKKQFISEVQ